MIKTPYRTRANRWSVYHSDQDPGEDTPQGCIYRIGSYWLACSFPDNEWSKHRTRHEACMSLVSPLFPGGEKLDCVADVAKAFNLSPDQIIKGQPNRCGR